MHATTVAVDLAKSVFQIAIADDKWNVVEQQRLTRSQFERWFHNRDVGMVVMEACGSAHHWGRWFSQRGIPVKLLPAAYIRAYVKRNNLAQGRHWVGSTNLPGREAAVRGHRRLKGGLGMQRSAVFLVSCQKETSARRRRPLMPA